MQPIIRSVVISFGHYNYRSLISLLIFNISIGLFLKYVIYIIISVLLMSFVLIINCFTHTHIY